MKKFLNKYPDGGRVEIRNGIKYIYHEDPSKYDNIVPINTISPIDNISLITRPLSTSLGTIPKIHNWNKFIPPPRQNTTVSFGTKDNLPNNDPRNKNKFQNGGVMKKIKIYKKLNLGGDIGTGVGLDPNAGIGGNAAKGAMTGASIGSVAGPWGTVIGGAVGGIGGGIYGAVEGDKARKEQLQLEQQQKVDSFNQMNQFRLANATNNGFTAQGVFGGQKYMANGGVANMSSTTAEFNGPSHTNGGIKEPVVNGRKLFGTEVEGKETISKSPDGKDFIFSDRLGFAKQHKPLAKAMGKIEKKLKLNPNDTLAKNTLSILKDREEELKIRQEQTKLNLGIANDLNNLAYGGNIKKTNKNWYDRNGLAHFPLGGTMFDPQANIDYYMSQRQPVLSPINSIQPQNNLGLNRNITVGAGAGDYTGIGTNNFSTAPLSKSGIGIGQIANGFNKLAPYAGIVSNLVLNNQANKVKVPTEALPDYVKYNPVDYTASRLEADAQRRSLNNNLTNSISNSAVASALKAKNLATTIGAKNQINQSEANINTEGMNRFNLFNSDIQQRRNRIDVDNRDRQYDKQMRFIQQKGNIANNASSIYQQQTRDSRLYDLENRKIDLLKQQDLSRGIYDRYLDDAAKKQKKSYKLGGIMKLKKS